MSAWQTLFSHTGSLSYVICNLSVVPELQGREVVQAVVWYTFDQNSTIRVPYEMDFQYYNGTWAVWKEWFGLQQAPVYCATGRSDPNRMHCMIECKDSICYSQIQGRMILAWRQKTIYLSIAESKVNGSSRD